MSDYADAQELFDSLVVSMFEDGLPLREAFEATALRYGLDNRRLLLVRSSCPPPPAHIGAPHEGAADVGL